MEDSVPFCKQCGAPQIRVIVIEPQPPAPADVSETGQPPILPPPFRPMRSAQVQWSRALPSAALGGALSLLSLLAWVIPFAILGPAFLAGGALSVMLYRRQDKRQVPTVGAGAQIGAVSGGFGFLFFAIMMVATLVYWPDQLRRGMLDSLSQLPARGYDPQKVQQVQELLKSPQGLTFFVVFALFVMLVLFVAGSSIGGALYAAWVRKRMQF